MGVIVVFLPDCPLVWSLLKHMDVGIVLNKKKKKKRGSQTEEAP